MEIDFMGRKGFIFYECWMDGWMHRWIKCSHNLTIGFYDEINVDEFE